jgi:hypothetical protein
MVFKFKTAMTSNDTFCKYGNLSVLLKVVEMNIDSYMPDKTDLGRIQVLGYYESDSE